jgi:hypothetical protein
MNFVLQPWQLLLAICAVGVPQVGGLPHRYTRVAKAGTGAWQSLASCQAQRASAPGMKKRLPDSHLLARWKAISDPASAGETPSAPTNAFTAESDPPKTFSVHTGVRIRDRKGDEASRMHLLHYQRARGHRGEPASAHRANEPRVE